MNIDDKLTALEIGLLLGGTAVLITLCAAAHQMLCRSIEAHRRIRGRGQLEQTAAHQDTAEPACHDPEATQVQAWLHAIRELDEACCERWWTSFATDHDPTCPNQTKEPR